MPRSGSRGKTIHEKGTASGRRLCLQRLVPLVAGRRNAPAHTGTKTGLAGLCYNLRTLQAQRRPVLELHAQGQAARGKDFLDFVERLATQVGGLEQLVFGALDQIADVVDVFGLQAVGRTHGQLEVVDRTQQHGVDLRGAAYRCLVGIAHAFKRGKDRDLVHEDAGRLANSLFGRNDAVGLDVEDQLVEVGALLDAGAFNRIADTAHGAVRSVEHDTADGVRAVVGQGANVAGHIAAALLDLDVDF